MSKPKVFEKPSGVKDYLPDAAAKLRYIETNVLECMERWGYREIMTPTIEYYDTVGVASTTSDPKLFKLLDKKGTTLVMRSDITAPIARVVSSLLKDEPLPLRLAYHANVFRSIEEEVGHEAEFYQTGVELIGDGSAEGDAEIVALAAACLKESGVENFKMALGHIGFLNGLFNEVLAGKLEVQTKLKECLVKRNFVEYRDMIERLPISEQAKEKLNGILRLRGGREICEHAQSLCGDPLSQAALEHLSEVLAVLEAYGISEQVMVDLTMIGDFSYYTGMTFEGYAADLGFPVCSGGRYDNLLQQFGRPAPAIGFALKTSRILELIDPNNLEEPARALILYEASERSAAFAYAAELRLQPGMMVEARIIKSPETCNEIEKLDNGHYAFEGKRYKVLVQFTTDGKGDD